MTRSSDPRSTVGTASRRGPAFAELVVFLILGFAIVLATRATIAVDNIEIGDFAANSLLIQDAKHLALFKGNYSRIGVNHPGPAILYVLAFGELVFHDLLHLVKSPFSGQLVAACFYTAAWTVVIGREFRKVGGSSTGALLAASQFLLAVALVNYNFLSGVWFPNLYVLPFAAMTLALARLADGRDDSLVALAISAGFLFNGHVSFVPMLAIVLIVALGANAVLFRTDPERRVVGLAFLRVHGRSIAIAAGVFALFFVPIVIETVRSYPGPVARYLAFGGEQVPHKLYQSFNFVAVYWGGLGPTLAAIAALVLAVVATPKAMPFHDAIRAIVVAFVAASCALVFYARYGVDYLEYVYLGYFYYAVPCLAIATLALVAFATSGATRKTVVAIAISAISLGLVYVKLHKPVRDTDQYHQPELPALYGAIKSAAAGGRIVLDLDNRHDWGHLWTNLVGVEAYARRRGEDLFCINRNWHVLFTPRALCTAAELQSHPRYLVRSQDWKQPWHHPVAFQGAAIEFSPYDPPVISDSGPLTVLANPTLFDDYLLESGWSPAEADYVWSSSADPHLALHVRPDFTGTVALDLGAFLAPTHPQIEVTAFADGIPVGKYLFSPDRTRQVVVLPVTAHSTRGFVDIRLEIDKPMSPRAAGINDDTRVLGVSLYRVEVKSRDASASAGTMPDAKAAP